MSRIPEWAASERGRWWSPFLAGAAAGLLAGFLVRRRGVSDGVHDGVQGTGDESSPGPGEAGWERWRDAWGDAVEGASDGLATARELLVGRAPLDQEALEDVLGGMACARKCRVRLLGEGIVEVVGSCDSDEDAHTLLEHLAAQPGVEVVVNRVWTPGSTGDEDRDR